MSGAPPPPAAELLYDWRGGDSRVRRMASELAFTVVFFGVGLVSTGCVCLLLPGTPYWISITGVLIFGVLAFVGYQYRDSTFVRERAGHPHEMFYLCSSSVLTIIVAYILEVHQVDFRAFLLIGVGNFCLVMVTQPVFDYGVMQSFVTLPLSMAVFHFKLKFSVWYVPCVIFPILAIYLQYYFVRHFNDLYIIGQAAQAAQTQAIQAARDAEAVQAAQDAVANGPAQAREAALTAQTARAEQATQAAQTAQAALDAQASRAAIATEAARAIQAVEDAQAAVTTQAAEAARAAQAAEAA